MNKLKILHSADWHVCDEFIEDARLCLNHLVEQADALRPGLIVISGDIYNHRQIRQESAAARLAFDTLTRLSNIGPVIVLAGTPSHDGRAPSMLNVLKETYPVWVESAPSQIRAYASPLGEVLISNQEHINQAGFLPFAIISCVPAFTKQFFRANGESDIESTDVAIAAELGSIFAQMGSLANEINRNIRYKDKSPPLPHILMGHWTIGGAYVHPAQGLTGLDIEVSQDYVDLAQADIVCMGHIHAYQQIGRTIFYPGSLFATDFGEIEQKGFLLHTLELVDMGHLWDITETRFIASPSPLLIKLESDLLNEESPEGVNDKLNKGVLSLTSEGVKIDANKGAVVRYEIKIYQDMAHTIDEHQINKYVAENLELRSFQLDIIRLPRPNVRSARVLEVDSLRDKLTARAEIIGAPLKESVLEKADVLETMETENVLDAVQKGVN